MVDDLERREFALWDSREIEQKEEKLGALGEGSTRGGFGVSFRKSQDKNIRACPALEHFHN